jgi:hypothetical protein
MLQNTSDVEFLPFELASKEEINKTKFQGHKTRFLVFQFQKRWPTMRLTNLIL